ncbi:putative transcriptional regulator, partial [Dysosmobacter welbionis]
PAGACPWPCGSNWVAGGEIRWSMWPSACSAVAAGRSFGPWAAASGPQRMGWRDCFTTSPWWARPC